MSLVAYGESSASESESEETSVPLPPSSEGKSDVRKMLGLLPPPKGSKPFGKQPVRISLPTIDTSRDSDDEEEENTSSQVKRMKMEGGGSRLTALLPKPKGDAKFLGKPRQGASIASMVPYTLSKRKQDSIKSEKLKSKRVKLQGKMATVVSPPGGGGGGGSDDSDEEPVSFFSHLDRSSTTADPQTTTTSVSIAPLSVLVPGPTNPTTTSSSSSSSSSTAFSETSYDQSQREMKTKDMHTAAPTYPPGALNSAPYHLDRDQEYGTGPSYSWDRYSHNQQPPPPPNAAPYTPQPYTLPHQLLQQNTTTTTGCSDNTTEDTGGGEDGGGGGGGGGGEPLRGTGPGVIIEKEALRRLAGGGHKRRGREEALNNIVDIMGDEVMEDVKIYRRHYGEDPSITKLYKVDNSKLKAPSSNQKRKHQITWLAHEAKEKELEYQKQWAVGSQARKDSRTKYGF